ncbi:M48 family metalloprotease [Candidatus Cytomitobacter primus]|nr:M48 family metalloprotease [Candidatus Cytomitobacter primus]
MVKKMIYALILIFNITPNINMNATTFVTDIEFDVTLRKIIKKIDPHLKYELFIIKSNEENAFTTIDKNGNTIIAVYTGLIKSLTAEEFTGVLCHEIGHIKHKHVINFIYVLNKQKASLNALSLLSIIPYINIISLILLSAEFNNLMIYSQQNEIDADLYAFKRLNQLKWPVKGLIDLFEKWSYKENKNYFSSHPWSSSRKAMAEKFIVKSNILPANIEKSYKSIKSRISKELYENGNPKFIPSNNYEKIWNNYLNHKYDLNLLQEITESKYQNKSSKDTSQNHKNNYYRNEYILLVLKAKILLKQGKYQNAIDAMHKVYEQTQSSEALFYEILWKSHYTKNIKLHEIQNYQQSNPSDMRIWNLFAYYYAKKNDRSAFYYYKSEASLAKNDMRKAKYYLNRALKITKQNSPFNIKIQDLKNAILK